MNVLGSFLQFSNDPAALAEWFLASIVLVVIVTLVYVFILAKSPSPEGPTVAKLETWQQATQLILDPSPALAKADTALRSNELNSAIENSLVAVNMCLTKLYQSNFGAVPTDMGVSDLAYILQSRASSAPQFAEPTYQLNNLRLKVEQKQMIDFQQASWGLQFANWLAKCVQTGQIKF